MAQIDKAAQRLKAREDLARRVTLLVERQQGKALLAALTAKLMAQPSAVVLPGTRRLGPAWRSLARRVEAQRVRVPVTDGG